MIGSFAFITATAIVIGEISRHCTISVKGSSTTFACPQRVHARLSVCGTIQRACLPGSTTGTTHHTPPLAPYSRCQHTHSHIPGSFAPYAHAHARSVTANCKLKTAVLHGRMQGKTANCCIHGMVWYGMARYGMVWHARLNCKLQTANCKLLYTWSHSKRGVAHRVPLWRPRRSAR